MQDKNLKIYNFSPYWTRLERINFLQRVILTHSYLYYVKDSPVWSDKKFDDCCKQLIEEQSMMEQNWITNKTQYGYVFYDFDGNTGFDLWHRLTSKDKAFIQDVSLQCLKG